ncbi:hypothetical protein [Roseisolibacter agri]|uniref:Uncharacterized protein n=1 Tax=Roseisolibacter agri TaxID=2014610 RepID=A0AA37VAR5_9BACT|nr:hypothetical protein [Roseisolibacter agri]GLC25708.1 hypothetical protein rosag_22210 [Roseisolibacter agri]
MEPSSPSAPIVDARVRVFLVVSLLLATVQLGLLVPAWREWRAGVPDAYTNEHLRQVLSAVSGLSVALLLPIPLLMMRVPKERRASRLVLRGVWIALMTVTLYTFWLHYRARA